MTKAKEFFNFETTTIRGNIGSDIELKVKTKERLEFVVAVNKPSKDKESNSAKWFKVVVFDQKLVTNISSNDKFKKGANVEIEGEVFAEAYKDKATLKIIAKAATMHSK